MLKCFGNFFFFLTYCIGKLKTNFNEDKILNNVVFRKAQTRLKQSLWLLNTSLAKEIPPRSSRDSCWGAGDRRGLTRYHSRPPSRVSFPALPAPPRPSQAAPPVSTGNAELSFACFCPRCCQRLYILWAAAPAMLADDAIPRFLPEATAQSLQRHLPVFH